MFHVTLNHIITMPLNMLRMKLVKEKALMVTIFEELQSKNIYKLNTSKSTKLIKFKKYQFDIFNLML